MLNLGNATLKPLKTSALWQFARIYVAKSENELSLPNLDGRAMRFLADRLRLLLSGYNNLPKRLESNETIEEKNAVQENVWRLKNSEKEILQLYMEITTMTKGT